MEANVIVSFGSGDAKVEYQLDKLTAQEMLKVQAWTGYKNRRTWQAEIGEEEPKAVLAAYTLCLQRAGQKVTFETADFDLETLDARLVDETGRTVEPMLETKKDGSLLLDKDGQPVPVRDTGGKPMWRYTDTGEAVPPTPAEA